MIENSFRSGFGQQGERKVNSPLGALQAGLMQVQAAPDTFVLQKLSVGK